MMYLISAVPGSGKTLRIVGIIKRKLLVENEKLIAQGKPPRLIYSNVKGLRIPGILPLPEDWRETPEHSVIITDEAQMVYPATGSSGISKDERVIAMTTHRHTGHDLYFLTQDPIFVDATLRKLVGHHEHLWRASSLQAATVYSWDSAQSSPMSGTSLKLADVENWTFPKEDYDSYDSATQHTHKFKMPKKILFYLVAFALVVAVTGWMIFGRADSFSILRKGVGIGGDTAQSAKPGQAAGAPGVADLRDLSPSGADTWLASAPLPALAGCAVLSGSCRAWNADGAQLDMGRDDCTALCLGPVPLDFSEWKLLNKQAAQAPQPLAVEPIPVEPAPVLSESFDHPVAQIPGAVLVP